MTTHEWERATPEQKDEQLWPLFARLAWPELEQFRCFSLMLTPAWGPQSVQDIVLRRTYTVE
jgi:hypothetical protein